MKLMLHLCLMILPFCLEGRETIYVHDHDTKKPRQDVFDFLDPTNLGNACSSMQSYHLSKRDKIGFNKQGRLLNSDQIEEYEFWATLGLAISIPIQNHTMLKNALYEGSRDSAFSTIFYQLVSSHASERAQALKYLGKQWLPEFVTPLIEFIRLSTDQKLVSEIVKLLRTKTGQSLGNDFYNWVQWLWKNEENIPAFYANLKGKLYAHIDPKFSTYFLDRQDQASIRMDEILWGGVKQDGIPPLRMPEMISAKSADYLAANDVVFGVYLNGQAKAYPKRILAWHEFFVDKFGEQHIAGVFCTLCGTVIAYDMTHNGVFHDLGTSGFLYRSNKLMYDRATQSLWSTIGRKPVVGPLINQDIKLKVQPVVTTTWGEWIAKHPESLVLSLNTGHQRNYDEGEAYKEYYASDQLMFPVPTKDGRLKNKDEVLVIRTDAFQEDPLAISIKYLKRKRIIQETVNGIPLMVLAEENGASRVYHRKNHEFRIYKKGQLIDSQGYHWMVDETGIHLEDGTSLDRIPSHNVFWFAWINAHPKTRLLK